MEGCFSRTSPRTVVPDRPHPMMKAIACWARPSLAPEIREARRSANRLRKPYFRARARGLWNSTNRSFDFQSSFERASPFLFLYTCSQFRRLLNANRQDGFLAITIHVIFNCRRQLDFRFLLHNGNYGALQSNCLKIAAFYIGGS